jgi:ribosome-associated translation inhibitor RaiA
MQIQVNTDKHIEGSAELTQQVETIVSERLGRLTEHITRVEVHLTDENSSTKSAANDKRCVMEARLKGLQPIAVTETDETVERSLIGAVQRLERAVKRTLDRQSDKRG